MNFTREPIIETVITSKDGCKLLVRNSKGEDLEEYLVDAVEIVSFGPAIFYRSTEKPKSFLLPVSDYEIIETKEMKMALKAQNLDRTIKIGGGKESSERTIDDQHDKKRSRRARRRKQHLREEQQHNNANSSANTVVNKTEAPIQAEMRQEGNEEEVKVAPPPMRKLFPPPPILIKEKLHQNKAPEEIFEDNIFPIGIDQEEIVFDERTFDGDIGVPDEIGKKSDENGKEGPVS